MQWRMWSNFIESFILYDFVTSTLIWNFPYFNNFFHSIWNARMSNAHALIRQICLALLEYCLLSSGIAIPIPGFQYCIAIQNSKTCSSLRTAPKVNFCKAIQTTQTPRWWKAEVCKAFNIHFVISVYSSKLMQT